jgi:hypothetical protein
MCYRDGNLYNIRRCLKYVVNAHEGNPEFIACVGAVRLVAQFAKVANEIAVWNLQRDMRVVKRKLVGTSALVSATPIGH